MKLSQAVTAISLVVALFVVTGCSSSTAKTASEGPTASPTSAVSTPPSQAELSNEAKVVVAGIHSESTKLEYAGGADQLPPTFLKYVTGKLELDLAAIFRSWREDGDVSVGPDPKLVWVRPNNETKEGSVVSMAACTDSSATRVKHADGSLTNGIVAVNYYYLKYYDGRLKAFQSGHDLVDHC